MKNLIIKSLKQINFRGEKNRTTEFSDFETTISGANGLGKSRHFDAFLWLLFGKDAQDRKDFEIKTKDANGKTLEKVNVEVSAILDINGSTNELKRILVENWVKPRGQAEEVFQGNRHEVFWNDVPLKVSEFDSRVAGIIDSTVFKMLTNPLFFPNMKWQDQREQLFQLAGTITDAEIATRKPEYAALLDKISGKSLVEFKRELSARKKKLKEELEGFQPRIDQTVRLTPEARNWTVIEAEIEDLNKQLKAIDEAIEDKAKANKEHFEKINFIQNEIADLGRKKDSLLNDEKERIQKESFKIRNDKMTIENDRNLVSREVDQLQRQWTENNNLIEYKNKELEQKRVDFKTEDAKQYDGSDNCSSCGQILQEEKRTQSRHLFVEAKKQKLEKINTSGVLCKNSIEDLKAKNIELNSLIESKQKNIIELTEKLNNLTKLVPENKEIELSTIPGYSDIQNQIQAKTEEVQKLRDTNPTDDNSELKQKKIAIGLTLEGLKANLNEKSLIERYKVEVENLTKASKDVAQQIADLERDEFTIDNFTKTKIEEAEKRVNGLFSFVKFQLFEYTIEGNESETCIPLVNGVPFGAANTASKILAGLDIIKALQRFHGAMFPIFCDNAESVNQYPDMDNQMIYLKVTNEAELTVSFENQLVNY